MTNKTIYDLLILMEGDANTKDSIDAWSDLILRMIRHLQTVSKSSEAAKEALFEIKSILDRYIREHENSNPILKHKP